MEAKDLFITPVVLIFVFVLAWFVRPFVSDTVSRKYFMPALTLKIVGAISLGLIYQFYYGGGDTFTYFTNGSRYIYEAFRHDPVLGLKLIFAGKEYQTDTFLYASKIYTYGDLPSYFVVRVAGFFDIFTFHTYSATAVLFAILSFSGLWALYHVFYKMFPQLHFGLAIAIFFVPSVFFWGSGILKDSITIGALGWATFSIYYLFIEKRKWLLASAIMLMTFYTIYTVKIYILLSYIPAAVLWFFLIRSARVRNVIVKIMVAPVLFIIAGLIGYYSILKVGEDNPRYNVKYIGHTAQITAEWLHYVSLKEHGSAYTLGDFDYSPMGMVRKFPLAIWVTLYRPYLWESHNIVMFLSAMESFALLLFTLFVFLKAGILHTFRLVATKPVLVFCFAFAITFSFAVGISTYNFGSLVRYKIPMYPFFVSGLVMVLGYSKRERKRFELAETE